MLRYSTVGVTPTVLWPIAAYVFILYSEIRTNLSYGHPLIPRRPDKRGLTVQNAEDKTVRIMLVIGQQA